MILHRTVKDYASKVFFVARPDKENRSVEMPPHPEKMRGSRDRFDKRSHDEVWPERRMDVLTRWAHSVLRWLEPIGYVGPTPDSATIADITSSQCIVHQRSHVMGRDCITADIAPEWLRLQANGVDCVSMYSEYTDEDGETFEVGLEAAEWMASEAIAQTLDANVEAFVREHDRRLWYSSRPKVAYEVVRDDNKRGLVPKTNHPWTRDELVASMSMMSSPDDIRLAAKRRADAKWKRQRAFEGPKALLSPHERAIAERDNAFAKVLDSLATDGESLMADWDQAIYDKVQGKPYIATEECPHCNDGKVPDENGDAEDCPICSGTAKVLACLGFEGLPIADPIEQEPEVEHDPPSVRFIQRLYANVDWSSAI